MSKLAATTMIVALLFIGSVGFADGQGAADEAKLMSALAAYLLGPEELPEGAIAVDITTDRYGYRRPAQGLDGALAARLGGSIGTWHELIQCTGQGRCTRLGEGATFVLSFEAPEILNDTATIRFAWSSVFPGSERLTEAYYTIEFVRDGALWRFSRVLNQSIT